VLVPFNLATDAYIAEFALLGRRRKEMSRQLLQGVALFIIGFLVNINVIKIPMSERFEHALMFWTLDKLSECESIQRRLPIPAFVDEDNLRTVARHARWQRLEPARTSWTAGTGFLKLARYFPGRFCFGFRSFAHGAKCRCCTEK